MGSVIELRLSYDSYRDIAILELLKQSRAVGNTAGKPIQAVDYDTIDLSGANVRQQPLQSGAIISFTKYAA